MADEWYQRRIAAPMLPHDYFDRPSPARMWNYLQGGSDHYELDRAAGDALAQGFADITYVARQVRRFLARAIRVMTEDGDVRQFLDLGCGLPAPDALDNVHEIAQRVHPDTRVVYVDNDKVVMAHARALLTSHTREGRCAYLEADVHDAARILAASSATLDFDRPVGLILSGVLGHFTDYAEARATVRAFVAAVPVGSYLVVHDGVDVDEGQSKGVAQRNETGISPYHLRRPDEFLGYFDGLQLLAPGIVPVSQWRPKSCQVGTPRPVPSHVGVARKVAR